MLCTSFVAPQNVGSYFFWSGIEPMSPALEGRFLTTEPPGKSPLSPFFSDEEAKAREVKWFAQGSKAQRQGASDLNPTV